MSIGFSFTGKANKKLPERCRALAEERGYALSSGENSLRFVLCPLGGELNLRWKEAGGLLGGLLVEGECQSTPAGPGFHKAAVELLDALKLKSLSVDDETGYYTHRDFEKMRREHFLSWLRNLILGCRDMMEDHDNVRVCWALDQYGPEDVPGTIVTPMGRFDLEKLAALADGEGLWDFADRFFLWPGAERDARFYRNQAVNALWEDCCFVPASRSEADEKLCGGILDDLERSARLDPSLPLPRAAYREVCALAGRRPSLPEGPELEFDYPVGYRKGLVTHSFDALRVTLPGSYQWDWEEWGNGKGINCCWDSSMESPIIWRFNGFRRLDGDAKFASDSPFVRNAEEIFQREIPNGVARWKWAEMNDSDGHYYQAQCEVISGPTLYAVSATFLRPEDRAGVEALLEKLSAVKSNGPDHTDPQVLSPEDHRRKS